MLFHWMTNRPYPGETGADLSAATGPIRVLLSIVLADAPGRRTLSRDHVDTKGLLGAPARIRSPS